MLLAYLLVLLSHMFWNTTPCIHVTWKRDKQVVLTWGDSKGGRVYKQTCSATEAASVEAGWSLSGVTEMLMSSAAG